MHQRPGLENPIYTNLPMAYCGRFAIAMLWRLCAGGLWACRFGLVDRFFQSALSCHPFAWKTEMAASLQPAIEYVSHDQTHPQSA